MSMELTFWKYREGAIRNHSRVYELACCDGETVEELETLPIGEILKKITSVFSDWTVLDKSTYEKEGHGAFQIFTTSQVVRFDCYSMTGDDMNLLIDILMDFGCPLYDPQVTARFDSWTDR